MSKEFKVREYKASDLVKGKMNEAFKSCTFGNPLKIKHKQHGEFFMINKEYAEEVVSGIMLSFCGLAFKVNESGFFTINNIESLGGLENEYTPIVIKIMKGNYEGLTDMNDPFMFISTMISTAMFFEDNEG